MIRRVCDDSFFLSSSDFMTALRPPKACVFGKSLTQWLGELALGLAITLCATDAGAQPIRVACVGDSITAGARVDSKTEGYPARLQGLLGESYAVRNFGVGGATLIRPGQPSVWQTLDAVKAFEPQIIVIALGTNDTVQGSRKNWERIDRFETDFADLVAEFLALESTTHVFVCTPTAMVTATAGLSPQRRQDLLERQPRLQELCRRIRDWLTDPPNNQVSLLELQPILREHPEWLTAGDGVHPNRKGYEVLAGVVAEAIRRLH